MSCFDGHKYCETDVLIGHSLVVSVGGVVIRNYLDDYTLHETGGGGAHMYSICSFIPSLIVVSLYLVLHLSFLTSPASIYSQCFV